MSSVPRWKADSASSKCYLCKTRFTLLNRRHHCRKCGQLVCAGCSAQSVRYFPGTYVLNAQNTPETAKSHIHYKTCDVCADEIAMIRRTLSEEASTAPSAATETSRVSEASAGMISVPGAKIAYSGPKTAAKQAAKSSKQGPGQGTGTRSGEMVPRQTDGDSDADLCPVCGVDLWAQFTANNSPKSSQNAFESYKETHVSSCLVAYDFAHDNLRLSSPPGGSHARNRMLVYNIPPIPCPSYETIKGGSSEGAFSNGDASGSTPSNGTFMGSEKDAFDEECVICLEDLRPGDKVGRLECLCVFHYKCIKDWFNKKSYAECPVHFLHS
ncbi:hypothetical protein OXX80_011759 [Metschnikowia pulcherrima]